MKEYIAIDLGASNGRTILGTYDDKKLYIEELNRFDNNYIHSDDGYFWDINLLFKNIKDGLRQYAKRNSVNLYGIGIDTWGVDFGLIDKQGQLLGNPYSYRDPRGRRGMKAFHKKYGQRAVFDVTGVANMEFNTVYQLFDMVQTSDVKLLSADKIILMPDLLAYMLTGAVSCEYTHATTTQMLNENGEWSKKVIDMIGMNADILPKIQMSGELKGTLLPIVAQQTGLDKSVPVYCVGSHDTASAVASVPATTENYAFLSSGTWSLLGMVQDKAIVSDEVFAKNFSNEGTVTGGIRMLRNIMGMWIIQNCKKQWDEYEILSWDEVVNLAEQAEPFASQIDVNASVFYDGGNMIKKIQQYCADTNQKIPKSIGDIARSVYESLAMCYAEAFNELEQIKGSSIDVLHVVGGGANNKMLNQMSANAINRPVIAGPTEATAIGNLMVQVMASGGVEDVKEMRQVIQNSFEVQTFLPQDLENWKAQKDKYREVINLYREHISTTKT